MSTSVRSYSKVNLGLAIGSPRPDGFHSLATLYQTIALHDLVTTSAKPAPVTRISLTSNDARVPLDPRNTAWKMVDRILAHLSLHAEVSIHIRKSLPIQGGMGAGSANAAATLIGLVRELSLDLPLDVRLRLAAQVGSDVPLFLVGGTVLGTDRGQSVAPVADVTLAGSTQIPCVIALPGVGVSTPQAFREWDGLLATRTRLASEPARDLHELPIHDTIEMLSWTYASVFSEEKQHARYSTSGILSGPSPAQRNEQDSPENLQGLYGEQLHPRLEKDKSGIENDLAANSLLALVRTGIENDFEQVVFPRYPSLREIKRQLMGFSETEPGPADHNGQVGPAVYAALSGSGSALFGLYRNQTDASAAQQRLQQNGVKAIVTSTMPRPLYWSNMFAE